MSGAQSDIFACFPPSAAGVQSTGTGQAFRSNTGAGHAGVTQGAGRRMNCEDRVRDAAGGCTADGYSYGVTRNSRKQTVRI